MTMRSLFYLTFSAALILFIGTLSGCGGPAEVEFAVKHLRDDPGEKIQEVASYTEYSGLDNSAGVDILQVELQFERTYRHQIVERLTSEGLSTQRVHDKIVEFYKLPPNDPEGAVQTALCPLSVFVPAGQKATVTVEWTERWAEGVINEGASGEGKRLGTYRVFLGYIEPCSQVDMQNTF